MIYDRRSILVYAFSNQWGTNISRRTLLELQKKIIYSPSCQRGGQGEIYYQIIRFHPRAFYQKYILHSHYSIIIGLGDFWGESGKTRIETRALNKFGDQSIDSFSPVTLELSLPILDLVDSQKFFISEHMGTYNCNWIAFQIQKEINSRCPDTRQLFFHLPKNTNAQNLASDLTDLLLKNHLL
jgi:hypothetical protein